MSYGEGNAKGWAFPCGQNDHHPSLVCPRDTVYVWVHVDLSVVFRHWFTHSIHFRSSQGQWLKLDQSAAYASVSYSFHCFHQSSLRLEPGSFCSVCFRETSLGCNTIKTGGQKMQMESGKKACKISGGFETYCTSHFFLSYWFTSLIKKERWLTFQMD